MAIKGSRDIIARAMPDAEHEAPAAFSGHYDYLVFDMVVPWIPSADATERWARTTLPKLGISVLSAARHEFPSPVEGSHAYTLLLVLSASHLAIHTAPEHRWVQASFALCDAAGRRDLLQVAVTSFFSPLKYRASSFETGVRDL